MKAGLVLEELRVLHLDCQAAEMNATLGLTWASETTKAKLTATQFLQQGNVDFSETTTPNNAILTGITSIP